MWIYDLIDTVTNPDMLLQIMVALFVVATVVSVGMPYLASDPLDKRMKAVGAERAKIRAAERAKLQQASTGLRQGPKGFAQKFMARFDLAKFVEQAGAREKLVQAGYRGHGPYMTFLFFRIVTPIVAFAFALFYLFVVMAESSLPMVSKLLFAFFGAYVGMQLPMLFVKNLVDKRQLSIRRSFPDALDLMLICVEAGMSIEQTFRKVAEEIGGQSIALAEELSLTTAELAYLQDRRMAYDNFAKRTDIDSVKSVSVALGQAEKYGTPLTTALRVLAQESRDMRMATAEKKAAGLPPKLTVPMILFFLPCLFVVILGPAAIRFWGHQ